MAARKIVGFFFLINRLQHKESESGEIVSSYLIVMLLAIPL